MSRQEAQAHIDRMEGYPLIAYLMDDDGKGILDNIRLHIPKTWTRAGDDGLSAEFDVQVGAQALNVDNMSEGLDELYAMVELVERHGKRRFTSGVIAAAF